LSLYSSQSVRLTVDYLVTTASRKGDPLPTIEEQRAEAEPTLERVAENVSRAKVDVRKLLDATDRAWTIRDIQAQLESWSGSIVYLAVLDMCRHGEVELEDDLTVRVIALHNQD
jgi:hypothetical protein